MVTLYWAEENEHIKVTPGTGLYMAEIQKGREGRPLLDLVSLIWFFSVLLTMYQTQDFIYAKKCFAVICLVSDLYVIKGKDNSP